MHHIQTLSATKLKIIEKEKEEEEVELDILLIYIILYIFICIIIIIFIMQNHYTNAYKHTNNIWNNNPLSNQWFDSVYIYIYIYYNIEWI